MIKQTLLLTRQRIPLHVKYTYHNCIYIYIYIYIYIKDRLPEDEPSGLILVQSIKKN